ncbi:synaptotagmin-12-like isoform X2 [Rhodnius prolixus]|uniref:synaptotagmin-12-like isoform X2 n=1 Tax=Rhodnius prolixus TaxID=13249 RepID=UPI003D187B88
MGVVGALCIIAVGLVLLLACLRYRSLCTRFINWLLSDREEKAVLTRLKGHYNANGYLVGSDSDIRLDWTGSFRRFESVDSESALDVGPGGIPPQPLRPAPNVTPPPKNAHPSLVPPVPQEEANLGENVEGCPQLSRAVSCESVSSDTSIAATDLVEPNVSGYLCIGIDYDSECGDLVVSVIEAKDLICKDFTSSADGLLDTFVTVYLLPTRTTDMQTRTYRSSRSPSYKEKFLFGLEVTDFCRSSLMFHVYSARREANTLLGEAHLHLADVPTRQPITTWLTLVHSNAKEDSLGEILFSLSYLPTAERLTVVIVKARNLKFANQIGDPYVKVYLLRNGKKVHKKRTQMKKNEPCPIFNEAMIFSVPNNLLQSLEVRVTVGEGDTGVVVGHVIVGCQATGKALSHWTQMLTALRKPIAMWHQLLQPIPRTHHHHHQ